MMSEVALSDRILTQNFMDIQTFHEVLHNPKGVHDSIKRASSLRCCMWDTHLAQQGKLLALI